MTTSPTRTVAVVTLGCARNEVDSEELAGRLRADGWELVADPGEADVALVNTCGFVEQAKKDSIDALLEAADLKDGHHRTRAVVAVGCLAERYGQELAEQLPEADAVLGFDSYAALSQRLRGILAGDRPASHTPGDRRRLLPLTPVDRAESLVQDAVPGHSTSAADGTSTAYRALLQERPWAPLKIASGCDRRCAFCAIPSFRGSFVSRRPADILAEARWLADRGVRELLLVSENSTSYGKDLGDLALLEKLLPELAAVDGIDWVRVSYLQPAEIRPGLLEAMATTPGVVPYYDISFQHAAGPLLRRMRRFGGTEPFLDLRARNRAATPHAGVRSNVIVGFPGETLAELGELELFLAMARLDAVGVFGYSDEEGTEGAQLDPKIDPDEIADRVRRVTDLVEDLTAQRAEERIGERVTVLVEEVDPDADGAALRVAGRCEQQGPEVDGSTTIMWSGPSRPRVGDLVAAIITASDGIDLIARPDE